MRTPLLFALALVVPTALGAEEPSLEVDIPGLGSFIVSEPCTHRNLTVYPLLSEEGAETADVEILTLAEALEAGVVIVHETDDVNQLAIENLSDKHVLAQAGDILRGGKQDRVIAFDILLPPRSGKVPIASFCVEQGRWSRRGQEEVHVFASSSNKAPGVALKRAYRESRSQREVWEQVATTQTRLADTLREEVSVAASPTSMELTLENRKVKRATRSYVDALQECVADRRGVVGVVVAVNGRVRTANLVAWHDLFVRLWPGNLQGFAVEAVAARREGVEAPVPSERQIREMLETRGGRQVRDVLPGLVEERFEYAGATRFVTRHSELGWVCAEMLGEED